MFNISVYLFLALWPMLYIIGNLLIDSGIPHAMGFTPLRIITLAFFLIGTFRAISRKSIKFDRVIAFFCLYLLLFLINISIFKPAVGYPSTVLFVFDRYLIPLSIYFVLISCGHDLNTKAIAGAILAGGILLATIGICEFVAGNNLVGPLGHWAEIEAAGAIYRTNGPFYGGIGFTSIVLLYFNYAYYAFKKGFINKKFAFFCVLLFAVGTVVNYSRAVWIAFAVCVLIYMAGFNSKSILFMFFFTIFLFISSCLLLDKFTSTRLFTERIGDMGNAVGRIKQYIECLGIFSQHPLMGIGHERYKAGHYYYIHNTYVRILVEYGIIAFVFYVLFIFSLIGGKIIKCFKKKDILSLKVISALLFIVFFVPNTIDVLHYSEFLISLFIITSSINVVCE